MVNLSLASVCLHGHIWISWMPTYLIGIKTNMIWIVFLASFITLHKLFHYIKPVSYFLCWKEACDHVLNRLLEVLWVKFDHICPFWCLLVCPPNDLCIIGENFAESSVLIIGDIISYWYWCYQMRKITCAKTTNHIIDFSEVS